MLARRVFLRLGAASAAACALGATAGDAATRLVEIRLRLALPSSKGASRAWIAIPGPDGALLSTDVRVEGDADAAEVFGRPVAAVAARWRPGATAPRLDVLIRAAVAGRLGAEPFAIEPPQIETLAGRMALDRIPGARWRVEIVDLSA